MEKERGMEMVRTLQVGSQVGSTDSSGSNSSKRRGQRKGTQESHCHYPSALDVAGMPQRQGYAAYDGGESRRPMSRGREACSLLRSFCAGEVVVLGHPLLSLSFFIVVIIPMHRHPTQGSCDAAIDRPNLSSVLPINRQG